MSEVLESVDHETLKKKTLFTICHLEEDECEPNPCQNGGKCLAHYFGGGFDCECPMGFRGISCQGKFSTAVAKS